MLEQLTIKNVALIDYAEINFTKGLNVLSGETGSGKSVILESINFVLGAKADKSLIRTGCLECFVQATFYIAENEAILNILNELDIDKDEILIISRKFTSDGKSSIKVNGQTITVSMLKKITTSLVDVHGQSEHFYLLKASNQLSLVDKRGGDNIAELKNKVKTQCLELKETVKALSLLGGNEQDRLMKLDLLKYQVNEIQSLALKDGEEEELLEIKKKLANQEKIINALNLLKHSIINENGVKDILFNAVKNINHITEFSDNYLQLFNRIDSVIFELNDIADASSTLLDDFELCNFDIDYIENRLDNIKTIKKKYGQTYNDIMNYLDSAKEEINKIENFADIANDLINKKQEQEKQLYSSYINLSTERQTISQVLKKDILNELRELGMPNADFNIKFNDISSFDDCEFDNTNGIDNIEFQFTANKGEPLKPLSSVISGGEMSRFMLSIKVQTAKYNDISTFLFDEIDSGISGNTAKVIAEKFARISKDVQIIAISHLPQISSMADNNLLITKTEENDKTITHVKTLSYEEKVLEIIRLIGGNNESNSASIHAKELINKALEYKNNI